MIILIALRLPFYTIVEIPRNIDDIPRNLAKNVTFRGLSCDTPRNLV